MTHAFYLFSIALILMFSSYGVKPGVSVSKAAAVNKKVTCFETKSPDTVKVSAVQKVETENKTLNAPLLPKGFSPKDLFKVVPDKETFDLSILTGHTRIDLSQYRESQLVDEDEESITYKFLGPNGHTISRTTDKGTGFTRFEEWEDSDGKVLKMYSEGYTWERFTDKTGSVYELINYSEGAKTLTHKDSATKVYKSFDYDNDGSVQGISIGYGKTEN